MILTNLLRDIFRRPEARKSPFDDGNAANAPRVLNVGEESKQIPTSAYHADLNKTNQTKIRFVCATREHRESFLTNTALGQSLALYSWLRIEVKLTENNTIGLPHIYNRAINEAKLSPAILVFIHDDVYLVDFYWTSRIAEALQQFQIIGVAGNRRRVPGQPTWVQIDQDFTWDSSENLSGTVGHGNGFPCNSLNFYGESMAQVKLLDGLLLAAHSQTLIDNQIYFDERFDFHFYDLDFCRQAEAKGLTMGTYPISVIHASEGNPATPAWRDAYAKYMEKWKS